jgi:hypothetical protein
MELVPMAEFTIVTRTSSSAWIPELIAAAGPEVTEAYIDFFTSTIRNRNTRAAYARACWQFLTGAARMGWTSRLCDRSMWLPGLRTFLGPNRPLSKNSLRCGCCTIFWSFGKSHHRIQHIPCAVQSMLSRRVKRPSGVAKTPRRCWIQFPRIRCPAYGTWRSSRRCSTALPV